MRCYDIVESEFHLKEFDYSACKLILRIIRGVAG